MKTMSKIGKFCEHTKGRFSDDICDVEQHTNMDFINLFSPALICMIIEPYKLYFIWSTIYCICMHIYRKIGKHNM